MTQIHKGDVAAIEVVHSVTYAFGTGRGTERRKAYHLVTVTSATRDGVAKSYQRKGFANQESVRYGGRVLAIGGDNQEKARRAFAAMADDVEFDSLDAIKAAVLSA